MLRLATLFASAAIVAGQATPEECASDVDGDGLINVNDLLGMLSQFGADGAIPEDVNGDNIVNVNDLLQLLSNFGGDLAGCGGDGMAGASDGTEAVNCCGGGAACGFMHCPALGAGQEGCVQPWGMPDGMDFETDCNAEPVVEAPLWCPDSPPQMCRMMCAEASACPAGQCNMREGSCCASSCQAFVEEPASDCTLGADCGGQTWTDCGTSCPSICGQPAAMICNAMCNAVFQCAGQQCFNEATGSCESGGSGAGGVGIGVLPPDLAIGRPFMASAKYDPTPHKYDPTPHKYDPTPHKYDPTPHKYDPTPHKYDPTPHNVLPIFSSAIAATSDWMTVL